MKGLYVINSMEGGGAERVFSALVTLVFEDKGGDEIEVILLDKKNESYTFPEEIKVHRIGGSNVFLSFFKYLQIVRMLKPDYVLSFLTRANNYNVFGSLLLSYKSIVSERSNTMARLSGRFHKFKKGIVRLLYKRATAIIAVSKGVKGCLINDFSIDQNKIHLLNNAVNIEKVTTQANAAFAAHDVPYIIAMGRLVKTKGFDYLIKAYAKAAVQSDLLILGEGPEMENLIKLVKKLNIEKKVRFMGFQANPYPYIKHSEFFVLPSELEGFPNALVEALSLGKAVLSTHCTDGPSEILNLQESILLNEVVEAEYGLLVNIRDEVALSKGLLTLMSNIERRAQYEKSSVKRAAQYSPASFYQNFKIILDRCI